MLLAVGFAAGCGGDGSRIEDHKVVEYLSEDDSVTDDGHYVDSYWFKALEDGSATANIDSSAFDPVLEVYDEDGRRILRNDDGGAGDDARASFRIAFGKFYEVVVTSYEEGETGKYELAVSKGLQFDSVITRGRKESAGKGRVIGKVPK
jgi:hypothetical protein